MKMEEAVVSRRVKYCSYNGKNTALKEKLTEYGVITKKNDIYVFVKYDGDINSKATRPDDLEYV